MRNLSKWLIAVWSVAFALLILNAGVSLHNIKTLIANDSGVSHSQDVSRTLVDLLSSMKDAETGQRGFIISDRTDYLEPYVRGETLIPQQLNRLAELTAGDDYYRSRSERLRQLIQERSASLTHVIEIHRKGGEDASRLEIRKGEGKELMDRIRAEIGEMESHEQSVLLERSGVAKAAYRSAAFTALVGGVLTIVMVAMAFILVRLEFARRQRAELVSRSAAEQLAEEQQQRSELLASLVRMRTAELESANHLLREEIAERTRAEVRANATSVELGRSNEELEKFAYVASHDLQEPLRKIQAFGDRLMKKWHDGLGSEGKEYLERMQSAATRMRTLIDDLLSYSRVTSNAKPFGPVDLGAILREVEDDLSPRIEQSGALIETVDLPTVEGDASQLSQLFQNLVGNALKFQKPGIPPIVTIRSETWVSLPSLAEPPPPAGNGFRVTISDNGIGFDQTYGERIFEVFQRLHGRSEYEGTGIGLAICRKIVERHAGSISALSRVGEGSVFVVDLPARSSQAVQPGVIGQQELQNVN